MALKTKRELAQEADTLATSFSYVLADHVIYVPTDYETGAESVTPPDDRKIWLPLVENDLRIRAARQFGTTFSSEQEYASFRYMVEQNCELHTEPVDSLLIKTEQGLRMLTATGKLTEPTGQFIPNTLRPMLNEDEDLKAEVLEVITEWVSSDEEAKALLRLLATSLAPHWSAGKYVLLIGNGRNGKSMLMEMLQAIFGKANCSSITRQEMSAGKPQVTNLNGKLMNIVFDGPATYLTDSGVEKTLVVGEQVAIRRLFKSDQTPVRTNSLFIEGLNQEPKSKDKSSALQARMVRFFFPNVYPEDRAFKKRMLSDPYVGALLSLLVDHYVKEEEIGVMLAPTSASTQLELDYALRNSKAMQFIKYTQENDPLGAQSLLGMTGTELTAKFRSWRVSEENDIGAWPEPDVLELFRPELLMRRTTRSQQGKTYHVRVVDQFLPRTTAFINTLEEVNDTATVVED